MVVWTQGGVGGMTPASIQRIPVSCTLHRPSRLPGVGRRAQALDSPWFFRLALALEEPQGTYALLADGDSPRLFYVKTREIDL